VRLAYTRYEPVAGALLLGLQVFGVQIGETVQGNVERGCQKFGLVRTKVEKEIFMSVTRIGEVRAKEGKVEELRDFLTSIIPMILSSEGSVSCELYQSQDDASKFVMIEVWDSVESHKASVKNIPPEKIGEIGPLLGDQPTGSYFVTVAMESNIS
jgi:quinol monooxygenase YgiN